VPASRSTGATASLWWCGPVKKSRTWCVKSFPTSCHAEFLPEDIMNEKFDITLNVNGHDYPIRVEPRKTLVDAIRDDCGQTGTHIGCEHGICGTCTIIVDDEAVRSDRKSTRLNCSHSSISY